MKKILILLAIVLTLAITPPAFGQDETPTPTDTDEPAETQEAAATEEPTSELASATPLPTLTALPTGTPLPTATELPTLTTVPDYTPTPVPTGGDDTGGDGGDDGDDGSVPASAVNGIYILVLTFIVAATALALMDRYTGYNLSKTAQSQLPPEWAAAIIKLAETGQKRAFEIADAETRKTEAKWDEAALEEAMRLVNWEFFIDPATSARHARKRIEAAPGTNPG